ncbi:MAG: ABC transporter permease [Clostridia bacterium]|nr:ABC transporter permease [Clostridia bacterium]
MFETPLFLALGAILAWLSGMLPSAVMQGIPLLCGATGETITEKSGNLNLGIPGIMYVGAICGVAGAYYYDQSVTAITKERVMEIVTASPTPIIGKARMALTDSTYAEVQSVFLTIAIPLLCCLAGALLMGLIYAFLTTTLRANQNVTGLALTTFGIGIGNYVGGAIAGKGKTSISFKGIHDVYHAPLLKFSWPEWFDGHPRLCVFAVLALIALALLAAWIVLRILKKRFPVWLKVTGIITGILLIAIMGWSSYGFMVYLCVGIALIAAFILAKTRVGLHLRAVGENPATADAAGIPVNRYKYLATCIGAMIAGLGGLYYSVDYVGTWSNDAFGDRGWLAIALVIFTVWRPNIGVLASILFGGLYILNMYIPTGENLAIKELFKMVPYVVTVVVLIVTSITNRKDSQPPEHLGLPYFREER